MYKRKRFLLIVLVCIMMVNSTVTVSAAMKELEVTAYRQEKQYWCWAAAARMAGKYKYPASTVVQGQIVAHVKGSSLIDEPANIFETVNAAEYVTNDTIELSSTDFVKWDWDHVVLSIDNNYPMIALVNKNGSGHYYVICGYNPTTERIMVIDPSDAKRYTCSWEEFNDGTWSHDSRPHKYTIYFDTYWRAQ